MRELSYEGRVFRPPSEAHSLIIQSTIGCSRNGCAFCGMYKEKRFRIRKAEDVFRDIDAARSAYGRIRRVFLADGDALVRDTDSQLRILDYIRNNIPECERVTTYASPGSVAEKSDSELLALKGAGLYMAYMGLESGSDGVLADMNKGCTASEIVTAGRRLKEAGILLSATAIVGLGGRGNTEHAIMTGRALSAMRPEYIGLLSLMLEPGAPLYERYRQGGFELADAFDMLREIRLMLQNLDSEGSVFRANHASNYVELAGTLNRDRDALTGRIDAALADGSRIKSEWHRGL